MSNQSGGGASPCHAHEPKTKMLHGRMHPREPKVRSHGAIVNGGSASRACNGIAGAGIERVWFEIDQNFDWERFTARCTRLARGESLARSSYPPVPGSLGTLAEKIKHVRRNYETVLPPANLRRYASAGVLTLCHCTRHTGHVVFIFLGPRSL